MTEPEEDWDPTRELDEKREFPCASCGAKLVFRPGTQSLGCGYCGHDNPIPQSEEDIEELDFREHLGALAAREPTDEERDVACSSCGAITTKPENLTAFHCPFCASPMVSEDQVRTLIRPKSLLPFRIDEAKAKDCFRQWLDGRWFAPSELKRYARSGLSLRGLYVPYWTYDAETESFYRGQRGDDYWDTKHVRVRNAQGHMTTQTRRVRKTRWRSVSGTVWVSFDDVLVPGSRTLPTFRLTALEPWDLEELVPYQPDFLSGFEAERYQIELDEGFEKAKAIMERGIRAAVHRDIGGDHQRINALKTGHDAVTFKHILLPIWISAYRYRGKVYRFLVNGRTGEVQGDRPYSYWKIVALVFGILAAIGIIVLLVAGAGAF